MAHTKCDCFLSDGALPWFHKKVLERIVVIFVKCCIYKRIEKRIGVAQPEKDAFPDRCNGAGTEWAY